MTEKIDVVAGILRDDRGRVLIAQRLAGTHMAGRWEFPGGKLEPGEAARDGLARELAEELGVEVLDAQPFLRLRHRYRSRLVLLDVWSVDRYTGVPAGREGQQLRWLAASELYGADILEADRPIIDALQDDACG